MGKYTVERQREFFVADAHVSITVTCQVEAGCRQDAANSFLKGKFYKGVSVAQVMRSVSDDELRITENF